MTTVDLPDFLLARYAEDSSVAFFASQDEKLVGSLAEHALSPDDHRLTHAARWRPERVLAECDAKRAIVERYQVAAKRLEHGQGDRAVEGIRANESRSALKLLALPYADHPDYLEEWKP